MTHVFFKCLWGCGGGGGMQISPGDLIFDIDTDKATIGWEAQVCVHVCV